MKLTHHSLFATFMLMAVTFAACKKNDDRVISTPTDMTNKDKAKGAAMFAPLRSTPQVFTVTAGTFSKLEGAQGTILNFYPYSFKDKNGSIITSGTVTIQLVEMYKLGDMIANRTATVTGNGVLKSGGEVKITATMGGQEVFANRYGIGFAAATAAPTQPMKLYYGKTDDPDSIVKWDETSATSAVGASVSGTVYVSDSALGWQERPYFIFDSCVKFEFINCDYPTHELAKYINVTVLMPDATVVSYATVFITYSSINVATALNSGYMDAAAKKLTYKGWVPIGPPCKICVVMPKSVDEYYYYEEAGTVYDGITITATSMTLLTRAQLGSKFLAL